MYLILQGNPSTRGLGYADISSVSFGGYPETELSGCTANHDKNLFPGSKTCIMRAFYSWVKGQNDTGMSRLRIALGRGGGSQEITGTKFLLPEKHFSAAEIILRLLVQLRDKEKG